MRLAVALFAFAFAAAAAAASPADAAVTVTLAPAAAPLTGPWRFRLGDDPAWAAPDYDDGAWERVDLTAPPGAHDGDVGLSGYVPGWGARGHAGQSGYAWYRLRVAIAAPPGAALALTGPPAVDDAYELYLDGRRVGGIGRFDGATPTAYAIGPRLFTLPADAAARPMTLAVRVWASPAGVADAADAGGLRIAPVLGLRDGAAARYREHWAETLRGYVVDVVEPLAFLALALGAVALGAFARERRPYRLVALALTLTALMRLNQAVYFWLPWESAGAYDLIRFVVLAPLALGAWVLAWHAWLATSPAWLPAATAAATALLVAAQALVRPWSTLPSAALRVALVALGLLAATRARPRREALYALPALAAWTVAELANELSAIGVRGIWFPFDTGVSRTQYAYVVLGAGLLALLWRRRGQLARA